MRKKRKFEQLPATKLDSYDCDQHKSIIQGISCDYVKHYLSTKEGRYLPMINPPMFKVTYSVNGKCEVSKDKNVSSNIKRILLSGLKHGVREVCVPHRYGKCISVDLPVIQC